MGEFSELERALDELDAVDWSRMNHAYGPAFELSEALRGLLSTRSKRQKALHFLSLLEHQGTVYQPTSYVIPFLVLCLAHPRMRGKGAILDLLTAFKRGCSYHQVHYPPAPPNTPMGKIVTIEEAWVQATHRAVLDGLPVYLELFGRTRGQAQQDVSRLLSECPERASEISPHYRQALGKNLPDGQATTLLMDWDKLDREAQKLGTAPGDFEVELWRIWDSKEATPLRVVAGVALTRRGVKELAEPTFALLQQPCQLHSEVYRGAGFWHSDPFCELYLHGDVAQRGAWLDTLSSHPQQRVRRSSIFYADECLEPEQRQDWLTHRLKHEEDPELKAALLMMGHWQASAPGNLRELLTDTALETLKESDVLLRVVSAVLLLKWDAATHEETCWSILERLSGQVWAQFAELPGCPSNPYSLLGRRLRKTSSAGVERLLRLREHSHPGVRLEADLALGEVAKKLVEKLG